MDDDLGEHIDQTDPTKRGTGRPPFRWATVTAVSTSDHSKRQDLVGIFDADDNMIMPILGYLSEGYHVWAASIAERLCSALNCTLALSQMSLEKLGINIKEAAKERALRERDDIEFVDVDPFSMNVNINIDLSDASISMAPNKRGRMPASKMEFIKENLQDVKSLKKNIALVKAAGGPISPCTGCRSDLVLPPRTKEEWDALTKGDGQYSVLDAAGEIAEPKNGDMILCPVCGHFNKYHDGTAVSCTEADIAELAEKAPDELKTMSEFQRVIRMRG